MSYLIQDREIQWVTNYELVAYIGDNVAYAFPCDKEGTILPGLTDVDKYNVKYCVQIGATWEVKEWEERIIASDRLVACDCGATVACVTDPNVCETCGRGYNLWGQRIDLPNPGCHCGSYNSGADCMCFEYLS